MSKFPPKSLLLSTCIHLFLLKTKKKFNIPAFPSIKISNLFEEKFLIKTNMIIFIYFNNF